VRYGQLRLMHPTTADCPRATIGSLLIHQIPSGRVNFEEIKDGSRRKRIYQRKYHGQTRRWQRKGRWRSELDIYEAGSRTGETGWRGDIQRILKNINGDIGRSAEYAIWDDNLSPIAECFINDGPSTFWDCSVHRQRRAEHLQCSGEPPAANSMVFRKALFVVLSFRKIP
jgi:hypothetical protein